MKHALILFFVPFVAFATCEDCQNLIDNLSSQVSVLRRSNDEIISANNLISSKQQMLLRQIQNGRTEQIQGTNAVSSVWDEMESTAEQMGQSIGIISADTSAVSQQLTILSNTLSNWSCSCDDSSGGCSCDFSGIISAINECQYRLDNIYGYVRDISASVSWIETCISGMYETQLPDIISSLHSISYGFSDVTNLLESIFLETSPTSRISQALKQVNNLTYTRVLLNGGKYSTTSVNAYELKNPNGNIGFSIFDFLKVLSANSTALPSVVNRLAWIHNDFQQYTNLVCSIHRDQTNYFSFFRGEIGVHGVLEDWTEQAGSYHDFLTNHYIQVVTGGTLSGNQSSKTNWFSRIETLLASLVFVDSQSTNTVDVSESEQKASQITSHFQEVSSLASNVSKEFSEQSQNIVELFRSWCSQFDSAALPSHVVLFTLPSEDEEMVVQFSLSDTPEIVAMVEAMRAITTFCWAAVGIFFLYHFLVWSARCVFVACQFIYKVISAVFK